tara:strand:+ start:39 stop:656 length:618 start_codon:yes stop_codon:yes gene_type:complete
MVVQYKGEGTGYLKQADIINKRLEALVRRMDDPNLSSKDAMKLDKEYDLLQRNFDKVMGLKKAGGKVSKPGMKIGGLTGNIQKAGTTEDTVRERSRTALFKKFQDKRKKLEEKFKGRGTSGAKEFRKQVGAAEERGQKKYNIDRAMSRKYGKDAYKSRAFGVSPEQPKRKTKPKSVKKPRTKTTAMRGGGLARSGSASLSGFKVR